MKKYIAILLAFFVCLSLFAGCGEETTGKKKEKEKEEKLSIVGTWEYQGSLDCDYIFYSNGTGIYRYCGMDMPFTYTDNSSSVSILFSGNIAESVLNYSIQGKILSIEDSFGDIMKYKWVTAEEPADLPTPTQPVETEPLQTYDWWEGSWYGWWCIKNGTGTYEPATNIAWDAYAQIEVRNDNTGLLKLWDTGTSKDEPLAYGYDITYEPGISEKGKLVSARVEFFPRGSWNNGTEADPMTDRDTGWTVDPADSSVSHFENMIEIKGRYVSPETPEDSFDYYIYLRPWGTKWEDVRTGDTSGCLFSDMMPIYHDNWYLPLLDKGYNEALASFTDGIAVLESQPSGGNLDPEGKADADGIVPLQTLKDVLNWCKFDTDYNMTYDEVAAKIGTHGKLIDDAGDYRYYRWLADEDNYIQITFSVKDGQEYWNVTQWKGLK